MNSKAPSHPQITATYGHVILLNDIFNKKKENEKENKETLKKKRNLKTIQNCVRSGAYIYASACNRG